MAILLSCKIYILKKILELKILEWDIEKINNIELKKGYIF